MSSKMKNIKEKPPMLKQQQVSNTQTAQNLESAIMEDPVYTVEDSRVRMGGRTTPGSPRLKKF